MKNSNFIVRIPEPCHEDWNKMQPDEKGKFCGSCSKSVFDFSNKTDSEIKNILIEHKDQKVCGHFKKTQIDRPLSIKIDLNNLPKNMSTTKTFAIALFLVFGTLLFSCTDEKNNKVGEIAIENTIPKKLPEPEGFTVGSIAAFPTETIEPVQNIETVEGEICIREEHVNGGLSIENISAIKDTVYGVRKLKDSIITKSVPEIIERTMGIMVINVVPEDTTTTTDSIPLKNTATQIGDNIISKQTDLSIYPNPSTGEFTIKYDVAKRSDIQIDIFDIKGAHIKSVVDANQYSGKYQIPVNLSELQPGIYFVNLIKDAEKFTEKVVIEK